jgi:hypothetical protein
MAPGKPVMLLTTLGVVDLNRLQSTQHLSLEQPPVEMESAQRIYSLPAMDLHPLLANLQPKLQIFQAL